MAFVRGSTHSILPLTSGNLVTLTYNLHLTEAIGGPLQRNPTVDPRLYPLFKLAKGMLENPDFLPEGIPPFFLLWPHLTGNFRGESKEYCLGGEDSEAWKTTLTNRRRTPRNPLQPPIQPHPQNNPNPHALLPTRHRRDDLLCFPGARLKGDGRAHLRRRGMG